MNHATFDRIVAFVDCCRPAYAAVTQTIAPASSDQHSNSNPGEALLGAVVFASGTNLISAFSSSVTLVDQGWGGQNGDNGVFIELLSNGLNLFRMNIAGSTHDWTTIAYDMASDPDSLSALNAALAGIDQSTSPLMQLAMVTNAWGYPGWELHTTDSSFSVTSDAASVVPEPASLGLLALGLSGLALARRKSSK